jgi:hypothetical protein
MKKKSLPWLSYVNLIALFAVILIGLGLVFFLSNGMLLGFTLAIFRPYYLALAVLTLIGFYTLFMANYSTSQGKSGWLFFVATMIFLPVSLCLIALAFSLLFTR